MSLFFFGTKSKVTSLFRSFELASKGDSRNSILGRWRKCLPYYSGLSILDSCKLSFSRTRR